MKKKLGVGIIIAGICLFYSIRHVNWQDFKQSISNIQWVFLIALPINILISHIFRSMRWKVYLEPIQKVPLKRLFCMNAVGFLTIDMFPFRIGEFTRPLLLKKKCGIPFSTGLATIAIERIFDALSMAVCLGIGILVFSDRSSPLFKILKSMGFSSLIGATTLLTFVVITVIRKKNALAFVALLVRILPDKYRPKMNDLAHKFFNGMVALPNLRSFSKISGYSAAVWITMASANFFTFRAFHFDLPWGAMFVVLGIASLGMSLPAAPGGIGTVQLAVQGALALYGIPGSTGFAYAVVTNAISLLSTYSIGLICVPSVTSNVTNLFSETKEVAESEEQRS